MNEGGKRKGEEKGEWGVGRRKWYVNQSRQKKMQKTFGFYAGQYKKYIEGNKSIYAGQ